MELSSKTSVRRHVGLFGWSLGILHMIDVSSDDWLFSVGVRDTGLTILMKTLEFLDFSSELTVEGVHLLSKLINRVSFSLSCGRLVHELQ